MEAVQSKRRHLKRARKEEARRRRAKKKLKWLIKQQDKRNAAKML